MSTTKTHFSVIATLAAASMLASTPAFAEANKPTQANNSASPEKQITICHATDSQTNPYVKITVSANAIANHQDFNGHGVQHEGGVWFKGIADHAWGDIIPAFTTKSGVAYPGQNATAGSSVLAKDCKVTAPVVVTTTEDKPVHVVTPDSDAAKPVVTQGAIGSVKDTDTSAPAVNELPHTGASSLFGLTGVVGAMTYAVVRRLTHNS